MLVQAAISQMLSGPDGWVRLDQATRVKGGLKLCFAIQNGRHGKRLATWSILCRGVHEDTIIDFDGGGISAISKKNHPAIRQYTAPWAELRWSSGANEAAVLSILY